MKKGIDVSTWQGSINWDKVKPHIDFAILRAGYGDNDVDGQFHRNAKECTRLGIPFGVYWFSYALKKSDVIKEADFCRKTISPYKLDYPVCYDWEYDSDNYANKMGIGISKVDRADFAKAFLSRIEEYGYYAMLYTNYDYLNKGFSELLNKYDIWWAQWDVSTPSKSCGIWQYTNSLYIEGISGKVDANYSYKDYPSIIKGIKPVTPTYNITSAVKTKVFNGLTAEWWNNYNKVANDVIAGKYGNGDARKEALKKAGYDYSIVQGLVNSYLG